MPPVREGYGHAYPDQVGGHKPCVPGFGFELMSPFGTVLPRRWPLVPLVGTGPPRTEPLRGVGRSGREGVMAVDRFCRNALVRTYGSARPGFRSVGKVCYLCRVYSIYR